MGRVKDHSHFWFLRKYPVSDPHLMASVSPPFDFNFDDLTREDQAKAQAHRTSQSRQLMTEPEVMALPQDKMLLFTDAVPHVIVAVRRAY